MVSRNDHEIDATATATAVGDLDETSPEGSDESWVALDSIQERLAPGEGPTSLLSSSLGRYVLLREIGAGAIGVVYAAYHEGLDRKLAIKLLNRRRAGRVDLEARLRREAKALAKLSHPNVVQVYDVGEFDGRVFVAMEFVEGETLSEWMRREHTLAEKLEVFVAAGRGLAAAHEAGVIHRDFKPDNVLVGNDGRPRVLDFGLARAAERLPSPAPLAADERQGSGPLRTSLAQLLHTGPASIIRQAKTNASAPDKVLTSPERPQLRPVPNPSAAADPNPATLGPQGQDPLDDEGTLVSGHDLHSHETQLDHGSEFAATILSEPGADHAVDHDEVVTRDGALLGTPAYMSPEQFRGQRVDRASDQYSFCVALYEALYGHRPFAGKSTMELALQTQSPVADPPPNSEVPAWLRQILLRGLSPSIADRFESMDALLAALEHDPSPKRRGRLLAGIAVVAVASLAFVVGTLGPQHAPTCPELAAVEGELWTPDRAAELEAAFVRSPLPYADAAWSGAKARLAAWSRSWAEQRVDACAATHLRQEFSVEVLDLRQACLDRGRRAFNTLTEQFASGEPSVIERAVEAAAALPDPRHCSDVNALLTGVEAPPESVASEVAELREHLAEIETLGNTGRWQHGLALAAEAVEQARETDYGPVLAEALLVQGRLFAESRAGTDALEALQAALDEADRHGHDELVPRIATELVSLSVYTRPNPVAARIWARRSITALDRIDEQGRARARGIWALGNLERLDGENAQAEAHLREALALLEQHAPEHPDHAIMLNDLGNALEARGRLGPARETYERALTESIAAFGPAHPRVGHARFNLARVAWAEGRVDEAHAQLDQARSIYVGAHGQRHRDVGMVELLAANLALTEGDIDGAAEHARQVKDIYDATLAPDNVDRAEPDLLLGHIAFARRDLDQALVHYRSCLATQRAALPPGHIGMLMTLTNLGLVHYSRQDYDAAIDALGEALALLEAGEQVNPDELRMGRQYLGDALLGRAGAGDQGRALAQFEAASEGCTEPTICAGLALRAARIHAEQGDAKAAARWADIARPLYLSFEPDAPLEPSPADALAELDQL